MVISTFVMAVLQHQAILFYTVSYCCLLNATSIVPGKHVLLDFYYVVYSNVFKCKFILPVASVFVIAEIFMAQGQDVMWPDFYSVICSIFSVKDIIGHI